MSLHSEDKTPGVITLLASWEDQLQGLGPSLPYAQPLARCEGFCPPHCRLARAEGESISLMVFVPARPKQRGGESEWKTGQGDVRYCPEYT